ncbi:MAG: bifunctional diaminohydroxyphosphoribosylaminopyrimidine deaminase/5-amino-6-(5-phosphoribosylamino)uracil reductase RibD [Pseudomonadota bacterium]
MKDTGAYMQIALELAAKGAGYTSPNPMVGAVVVDPDGRVIGQGYHQSVGGPHAEVHAIDDAGPAARGATLFVTLEPCNHFGRTPPCTQKILDAGISHVVVAMPDPNPKVKGGGNSYLASKGVRVTVGVCEEQARRLNESFIKYITTRRPFVTLKCAATLDGRLATRTGDSRWVTGEASRAYVHSLRHAHDAILVGVETVKKDNPRLTTRIPAAPDGRKPKDPLRVILDTRLTIPDASSVLHPESDADTLIVTGPINTARRNSLTRNQKVRVLESPLQNGRIDLNALMDSLGDMGVTSLFIEGGSRVIAASLAAGIVDKVLFFYAPKISGGDDGVPICKGPGPEFMKDCIPVNAVSVRQFDNDILIEGYLK